MLVGRGRAGCHRRDGRGGHLDWGGASAAASTELAEAVEEAAASLGASLSECGDPHTLPSTHYNLTQVGGTLFFTAGHELWKSDGTKAGTVLVKEIAFGARPPARPP